MPSTSRSGVRTAAGVGLMFASNGAAFASLLPWYPLLTQRLGLTPAVFGLIVASFAAGAILSSALPAPLIARFGPLRVAVIGTAVMVLAVAAAAWSPNGWVFAGCLFLAGFCDACVDVAQNVAGIRVQDALGRSVLSSMHALWSLGGLLAGALATTVAAAGLLDIRAYLAVTALLCLVLVMTGAGLIGPVARHPDRVEVNPAPATGGRAGRLVFLAALPLVVIAICGTMVEDIGNNWAALAGVQIGGLSTGVAGVAFSVMIGSQCVGRFTGDLLIQRLGRAVVARLGGALIGAGGLFVVIPGGGSLALLAGFALAGYGCATLVPSAMSAAAKLPGVSEGAGVTLVSWLMRLGFLGTSPLIGALAGALGLRWGLCVLVAVGVATLALAGSLRGRPGA